MHRCHCSGLCLVLSSECGSVTTLTFYHLEHVHMECVKIRGGCGSGLEPASSYQKVAGLIPLVCMSK